MCCSDSQPLENLRDWCPVGRVLCVCVHSEGLGVEVYKKKPIKDLSLTISLTEANQQI